MQNWNDVNFILEIKNWIELNMFKQWKWKAGYFSQIIAIARLIFFCVFSFSYYLYNRYYYVCFISILPSLSSSDCEFHIHQETKTQFWQAAELQWTDDMGASSTFSHYSGQWTQSNTPDTLWLNRHGNTFRWR